MSTVTRSTASRGAAPQPQPIAPEDRDAALAFIAVLQEDPATACAFVGTRDDDLEEDLDGFDQPWTETLRVIRDPRGRITGAVVLEWDEEVGTAWIHGPWATPETWERDAPALLDAAVRQAPVRRHQVFASLENTRLAALAEAAGWTASAVNTEFTADRAAQARPDAAVRRATAGDLPALTALHEAAFPDTYATARQLLAPEHAYAVLVLPDDDGALTGYVAGQPHSTGVYLDYVAVDPARRRCGAATRLVGALADALPGDRLTLTCDTTQPAAVGLYERLGFERTRQTRAWDLRS